MPSCEEGNATSLRGDIPLGPIPDVTQWRYSEIHMARLSILLADDHTMVRQGLKRLLEDCRDWDVVAEAGNGRDAVREAETHHPDVAILDIGMPLLNGVETTRQIT